MTEHYKQFYKALPAILREKQDLEAIEIGVGPLGIGFLSVYAAAHCSSIVGVDPLPCQDIALDDALLQDSLTKLQSRVTYIQAKGETLPFDDTSFDLACCINVLDHTEIPDAILRETGRVLRSGGLFLFGVTTRSLLGGLVWGTRRRLKPKDDLFLAHPYSWRYSQVKRKLEAMGWKILWQNSPSLRDKTLARSRMSCWILGKG